MPAGDSNSQNRSDQTYDGATLIATFGERPAAITQALDLMVRKQGIAVHQVVIIHTHCPRGSALERAMMALKPALEQFRERVEDPFIHKSFVCYEEIATDDGRPLTDVDDEFTANDYFEGLVRVLYKYRMLPRHLLISGGRKVMSAYALLAASLMFSKVDRVWTIHSPRELMQQERQWTVPDRYLTQVRLIRLPIYPSRALPGFIPGDVLRRPLEIMDVLDDLPERFRQSLSGRRRQIFEYLINDPTATNRDIAEALGISARSIEDHLDKIYNDEMPKYYDFVRALEIQLKRDALREVARSLQPRAWSAGTESDPG